MTANIYEQGNHYPYVERLILICQILNVPMDYLFRDQDRIFQDYTSLSLFRKLREADDEESRSVFNLLQKLLEYKNMDE